MPAPCPTAARAREQLAGEITDRRGACSALRVQAAHVTDVFALHRDDQVGAVDIGRSELVAPVVAGVDSDDLERRPCPAAHRLVLDDMGSGGRDRRRATRALRTTRPAITDRAAFPVHRNTRFGTFGSESARSRSGKPRARHSYWPILYWPSPLIGWSLPCRRGSEARPSLRPRRHLDATETLGGAVATAKKRVEGVALVEVAHPQHALVVVGRAVGVRALHLAVAQCR